MNVERAEETGGEEKAGISERLAVSIVVPAYNEGAAVTATVEQIRAAMKPADLDWELIVVDDGSTDDTSVHAEKAGARVVRHPTNLGYGNALLSGIASACHPIVAICDADGSYPVELIPELVQELASRRLDMLVGARQGANYHGSFAKRFARLCFRLIAEFTCGRRIPDINSGLRVMRRDLVLQLRQVLCGGFSFTTSLTMIAFLTYRFVGYRAVPYYPRQGRSHVRYLRDTLRALQILVMTIVIFNPVKMYLLLILLNVPVGLSAIVAVACRPDWQPAIGVASVFLATAEILFAIGLLAEQRRVAPGGIAAYLRRDEASAGGPRGTSG